MNVGMRGNGWVLLAVAVVACAGNERTAGSEETSNANTASTTITSTAATNNASTTGNSSAGGSAGSGAGPSNVSTTGDATGAGTVGSSSSGGGQGTETTTQGTGAAGATGEGGGGHDDSGDVCLSASDDPLGPQWNARDLQINGEGFEQYDGLRIRLLVYTDSAYRAVAEQDVVDGGFRFEVPAAASHYSNFSLYVDVNDDDSCDPGETSWTFTTGTGGCSVQPCPNEDGVVVENVRLPLEDCLDCNPWNEHADCYDGVGADLTQTLLCPFPSGS